MGNYTLHNSVLKTINTIKSEKLRESVKEFINFTPIDFIVPYDGAFRTAEFQNEIFNRENKPSKCDGYKIKSKHQSGLAVDIVPWVNGKPTWERDYVMRLSGAFYTFLKTKGIKFINGGDWNNDGDLKGDSWDGCHFEVLS